MGGRDAVGSCLIGQYYLGLSSVFGAPLFLVVFFREGKGWGREKQKPDTNENEWAYYD